MQFVGRSWSSWGTARLLVMACGDPTGGGVLATSVDYQAAIAPVTRPGPSWRGAPDDRRGAWSIAREQEVMMVPCRSALPSDPHRHRAAAVNAPLFAERACVLALLTCFVAACGRVGFE